MERRQTFVQVVATLVTAVLAALVVIGLTATRLGRELPVTPSSTPSPTAIAARDYGPPSGQANLLYVRDPARADWLTGLDWTGAPRATVKLDAARSGAQMAPDGQSFSIGLNAKGGAWRFLDRLGNPVAGPLTLAGALLPVWADDNQHVCATSFDQQTLTWSLWTELASEAPKQVRVVRTDATLGESSISVVACSFKNDVAIAVRIVQAWPTEYWLIRLSDGSVLLDQSRGGQDMSMFTASADASLIAENSSRSTGQLGGTAPATLVVHASDGGVVASLDPSMGVLAFSGDDSAALVTLSPWTGNTPIHLGVVDVASGRLVWQDDGRSSYFFGQFVAQPKASSFAIAYPTSATYPSPSTIVIVNGDGTSTTLDRLYTPAW